MSLDATVRARVDVNLKNDVEHTFEELGITTYQAINMFLKRVKYENGIPFELKIPNKTTLNAMNEAKNLIGDETTLEELTK